MAEKFIPDDSLSPKVLASHLRQPDGEIGRQIALHMNKGNHHFCLNSYELLNLQNGQHVLEIGMGNGFFVKDLLAMAKGLSYTGVDFSATMIATAEELNQAWIEQGNVRFKEASIEALPFDDHTFDCITTTNTLYFWPQPLPNAKELLRVLKPNGKLLVAYRAKSCMEQMQFTQHGFDKYESQDVEQLLRDVGFNDIATQILQEPELEFDGKVVQMEGLFTTGVK